MSNKLKVVSVLLVMIMLTALAVFAGLGLAIWDTGSSVTEVFGMTHAASGKPKMGQTQTITIADDNIKNYITEEKPKANIDEKITDKLEADSKVKEEVKTDTDDVVSIKDLDKEAMKPQIGKKDEEAVSIDEENSGDDNSENDAKEKEREPLKITSEISGIAKVVRAGDETDEITNELPVPAQITEVNYDIDPLADYPLPFEEVDNSYFDDALFIGDSRVAGLAMNSGTNATFYAVTSFQVYRYKTFKVVQTPSGKVPIFDVMPYDKFTKIYIKVGLNELGSVNDEPFLEAYTSLINDLRAMQPRAIIYIQAILPVTQVKSQTDRVHCNENITRRNENLKSFAELMKCYYVEVGPYFADETGALKAETTADGIHMYSKYMPQWIDALRKQAVVWPRE